MKNKRILSCVIVAGFLMILSFMASANRKEVYLAGPITGLANASHSPAEKMNEWKDRLEYKGKIQQLEKELKETVHVKGGQWNIYVKNLSTGDSISINKEPGKAASLIKLYVMAYAYEHLDASDSWIEQNLWAMITYSDNEAFNALVRECGAGNFAAGARKINQWLEENNYIATKVYNTLEPSRSVSVSIAPYSNPTSAEECGRLLEEIYNGTCVSREASKEMLDLLCQQQHTSKIPEGIPESVVVANKTGEALDRQHDVAIVFGPKTDYILCVMSEGCYKDSAIFTIRDISEMVYQYLQ